MTRGGHRIGIAGSLLLHLGLVGAWLGLQSLPPALSDGGGETPLPLTLAMFADAPAEVPTDAPEAPEEQQATPPQPPEPEVPEAPAVEPIVEPEPLPEPAPPVEAPEPIVEPEPVPEPEPDPPVAEEVIEPEPVEPVKVAAPKPVPKPKPEPEPKPEPKPRPKPEATKQAAVKPATPPRAQSVTKPASAPPRTAAAGPGPSGAPPTATPRPAPAPSPAQAAATRELEGAYLAKLRRTIEARKYYPRQARRARHEGTVKVRFKVLRDGSFETAEVVGSSGSSLLDAAALETLSRVGRFAPFPNGMSKSYLVLSLPLSYELR